MKPSLAFLLVIQFCFSPLFAWGERTSRGDIADKDSLEKMSSEVASMPYTTALNGLKLAAGDDQQTIRDLNQAFTALHGDAATTVSDVAQEYKKQHPKSAGVLAACVVGISMIAVFWPTKSNLQSQIADDEKKRLGELGCKVRLGQILDANRNSQMADSVSSSDAAAVN